MFLSKPLIVAAALTFASFSSWSAPLDDDLGHRFGTVTLSWVAPTENTDGSPVSDLAGYKIAYGTHAAALTQSIVVDSGSTTSANIENLAPGIWYFAVISINTAGVESEPSTVLGNLIL